MYCSLPEAARNLCAGLDWAGNSGKLIAHLLFKQEAMGQTYTISSGQNATWEQIAGWYIQLLGTQFYWMDTQEYARLYEDSADPYRLRYDRLYNRDVDCSKVLAATGLTRADFVPLEEAIGREIAQLSQ